MAREGQGYPCGRHDMMMMKSVNHMKFTEEYVVYTELYVLVKRNVYKWAVHEFATT